MSSFGRYKTGANKRALANGASNPADQNFNGRRYEEETLLYVQTMGLEISVSWE
jgi:hypothetical protein